MPRNNESIRNSPSLDQLFGKKEIFTKSQSKKGGFYLSIQVIINAFFIGLFVKLLASLVALTMNNSFLWEIFTGIILSCRQSFWLAYNFHTCGRHHTGVVHGKVWYQSYMWIRNSGGYEKNHFSGGKDHPIITEKGFSYMTIKNKP